MSSLVRSCPRLAGFPQSEESMFSSIPLSVAHEWLVHEFGEAELDKVVGLPVPVIASLYPESNVATFALIRGTTTLDHLQELVDAFAVAMVEEGDVPETLEAATQTKAYQKSLERFSCYEDSPIVIAYRVDVGWALSKVTQPGGGLLGSLRGFFTDMLELALFVSASYVVAPEHRAKYAELSLPYEKVFAAMGLIHIWDAVSPVVNSWREETLSVGEGSSL